MIVLLSGPAAASVETPSVATRAVNDGQLLLEDVPPIPAALPPRLDRYQQLLPREMLAWSLDGKTLYQRSPYQGVGQLQAVRGRGGEAQQLTRFSEPVREVARQHQGELLAFTMDRGGSGFDQLHLLDPISGASRALTDTPEALNNRMVWDHQGQHLAFRSTRRNGASNDIWILPIDAPEQARMVFAAEPGALWKPVAFTRDGQALLVQQYQGITDSRIHLLDLTSGTLRELVGHPEYDTSNIAIGFDRDDSGVFFVSNMRGRAAEIGWVSLDQSEAMRWVDNSIGWDVTGFELSPDSRRGAFVTNENGVSRLYVFNTRQLSYQQVKQIPVGVISDLRFSPDGRQLGFTLSTPTSPGDVYAVKISRFSGAVSRPRLWAKGGVGDLPRDALVTPRLFSYPTQGGSIDQDFNIPGFAYLPEGDGPFPVVIYIHGGPESQFRPNFNITVQIWASELGVAVLAPNVRGSLGYGRAYLSLDDGRRREDAVRDIGALLDWIASREELDQERVAVFGASYGGYMALASAVHYSDRLVAAVDRASISNFVSYLENTQDYRRDLRRFEYGDERDPAMRTFLESISPLNNVERIHIPMMIVQGQNDPVVPVTESAQMVQALRQQGQTVWYLNALNEGHGYEKKENRDVYQQVTYLFLQRYLLGSSSPSAP